MWWLLANVAVAGPVAVATDASGARTVIHQPDGSLALWTTDGEALGVIPAPRDLTALCWRGDTLVGTGPSGTWVWNTADQQLLYKFAVRGEPMLSEDGTVLDVGPWTVVIGEPLPAGTRGR